MEVVDRMRVAEEPKWLSNLEDKSTSGLLAKSGQLMDPIVYKLVRVDDNGRLIPATDDELMEVEDLLESEKNESRSVDDGAQAVDSYPNKDDLPSTVLEGREGSMPSDRTDVAEEGSNAQAEYTGELLPKVNEEERLHLRCESPHVFGPMNIDKDTCLQRDKFLKVCERTQSGIPLQDTLSAISPSANGSPEQSVECAKLAEEVSHNQASDSALVSSRPNFSRLNGELDFDKLTLRDLQDTFLATFGRKTSAKDKQWLKRRIAMGLTNSCNVPLTSFIIKDRKIVKKDEEDSTPVVGSEDPAAAVLVDCGKDSLAIKENQTETVLMEITPRSTSPELDKHDNSHDGGASKRVRKPTKRYIEELSDDGAREHQGRFIASTNRSGQTNASSNSNISPAVVSSNSTINPVAVSNAVLTRHDSLGGTGVQVPCVSRIRRCRPRKSIMALTRFQPSGIGTTTKWAENGLGLDLQLNKASEDEVLSDGGCNSRPDKTSDDVISEVENCDLEPDRASKDKAMDIMSATSDDLPMVVKKVKESHVAPDPEPRQSQEPNHMDSSDHDPDEIVNVGTKGGLARRKHHRAWALTEVVKLVDGVAKFGAGKWSEIKRLSFSSVAYRTPVDLKDKWRNLLKASFAALPSETGGTPQKNASAVLPVHILLKVRELARLNGQLPKKLPASTGPRVVNGDRDMNEGRAGYL